MFDLLRKLCTIHSPSGDEKDISTFVLTYINQHQSSWKYQPQLFYGDEFQDCIIAVFGKPRTAVFAHLDNIGYTVRYGNELVKIGGPRSVSGYTLVGKDSKGDVECELETDEEGILSYKYNREIDRGTNLSFKMNFREDDHYIQSCYLDNRLGVAVALTLCETLKDGIIVFSCREEHGGGSVPFLAKFIYENYKVKNTIICDITWITHGVVHGKGVALSMRDSGLPRRAYIYKLKEILEKHNIPFQLEVESSGGSDGNELQRQPYPFDWCFVGAPEDFVHTPDEKVHKDDVASMLNAYRVLMENL
ncbi:MAG: M20/M25/M40 family metallo-hydrolase [Bacteroidota bacterium]